MSIGQPTTVQLLLHALESRLKSSGDCAFDSAGSTLWNGLKEEIRNRSSQLSHLWSQSYSATLWICHSKCLSYIITNCCAIEVGDSSFSDT